MRIKKSVKVKMKINIIRVIHITCNMLTLQLIGVVTAEVGGKSDGSY